MAAVGTAFNWVLVSGGVWTRIWQGPLVPLFPFQALELGTLSGISNIRWTLDGYNAAPPFYERHGGRTNVGFAGNPPTGHTGSYAAVVSFRGSPWAEFWILTNSACFAHIAVA
jgi:prepilin-type processing-associated H-X9-DG protein